MFEIDKKINIFKHNFNLITNKQSHLQAKCELKILKSNCKNKSTDYSYVNTHFIRFYVYYYTLIFSDQFHFFYS